VGCTHGVTRKKKPAAAACLLYQMEYFHDITYLSSSFLAAPVGMEYTAALRRNVSSSWFVRFCNDD